MPALLARRSRGAESDDDESNSRAQTPNSVAPDDRKRARRDEGGSAQRLSNQDVKMRKFNKAVNGDTKPVIREHQPGAIVRVKLRNFVTYSLVEFFPGPSLNMVIGPNGSGKSTLVCAICLGLGWGSQHLGRARDVSEFVKTGTREATIEIELKKGAGTRRNPVITRIIKKENNKTVYTLNGQAASAKEIQALARSMDIQIDNLCQFLPQDKVVEFAGMTPVELLQSTQRAAAAPEMLENHENLKSLRAHQKELLTNSKNDRDTLKNLDSRQEMQREDVERLKQRDQIKQTLAWLEKCRPIPRYRDAKARANEAKATKIRLAKELKVLTAELAPALRRVNNKQSYEMEVRKALHQGKDMADKADRSVGNVMKKISDLQAKLKDFDAMADAEKGSVKTKREDRNRVKGLIARYRKQMEEEPELFDPKAMNDRQAQITIRLREIEVSVRDLQDQTQRVRERGQTKQREAANLKERLDGLDTQVGQQELKLQQLSSDTHKVWKWIQDHPERFKKKVYGPPLVECSVKDPKFTNAVEALFQADEMKAFTAQTHDDFKTLQGLQRELHVNDVAMRVKSDSSMDGYRPPLSPDELKRCGMQGWAIDYLDGPDTVLARLCDARSLHETAITLGDISQDQYDFLENSNVKSWVAGGTLFQVIRRREYGVAGNSTRTRKVNNARFWTNQPADASTRARLTEQLRETNSDMASFREEMNNYGSEKKKLNPEYQQLKEEQTILREEKDQKQKALTSFKALPTKLKQEEEKLQKLEDFFNGVRGRLEKIQQDKDKIMLDKARVALKYADSVAEFRKLHDSLLELELQHIEAKSDTATLKSRNENVQAILKAKQDEEKEASETSNRESAIAKGMVNDVFKLKREAVELAAAGDPFGENYLGNFGQRSVEDLEAEIESEKGRLELTSDGNEHILREFETRQERINKLRHGLEKSNTDIAQLASSIDEIRTQWEPQLDALVEKISTAFSDSFQRIGCAGQVTVFKASGAAEESDTPHQHARDESPEPAATGDGLDFAHWALHISVKFRASEPLSLLDAHRQSGGERAVSTIFYLMALQSLSRAPFRVVDEINQGMDPRNERMVHGRMVDVACGEDGDTEGGSQYFLITPKLLSGLKYRRGMRVLNIVSGEKMPAYGSAGGDSVDFGAWVTRAKELGGKVGRVEVGGMLRGIPGSALALSLGSGAGQARIDSGVQMGRSFTVQGDEDDDSDGDVVGDGDSTMSGGRSFSQIAGVSA